MKITKDNCEAFFLDYHEGNLSLQKVAELMIFLEQHPDLKNEFYSFENINLKEENEFYPEKNQLKKNTSPSNHENLLIGYIEGALESEEKKEVQKLLTIYPSLAREIELFEKTILVPDEDVIYENKESLKKRSKKPVIVQLYPYLAVAASVVLIFGIYIFFDLNKGNALVYSPIGKRQISSESFNLAAKAPEIKTQPLHVKLAYIKNHTSNKSAQPEVAVYIPSNTTEKALPIDSISNKALTENESPAIASIDSMPAEKVFKTISAADFTEEKIIAPEKKFSLWNAAVFCSKGINKILGKKLEMKKEVVADSSRVEYIVTAGRFGFSRSVSK
jgi:hypothetical protein